ncbi:diguanylate cyclase domain-containing protein [Citromicrobium bathyomarinum]|uniref:diguanylate cyclase domain-containing protein n=1 Tax=Citromicrobium bathyomarinum TaxID=72174 RepID=UPI001E608EE4|nr:diguanylate cyclase [Citromicrobium bathyomarinum]MCD1622086.1 diguanylate cyclase [Citromicrobium bathyomarinum]
MSTLIQQADLSSRAQTAPPPTWLGSQPGRVDPLVDRALALAKVGAWSCNLSDNGLSWTSGVYDIFGLPRETAVDRRQALDMYTDESRDALERLRTDAIARGGIFTLDAQVKRADGAMRWMRIHGEMIHRVGEAPILQGVKQDVTEEKQRSEALRRLAENDALTGLANRAIYESKFLNGRRNGSAVGGVGALVLFDLDDFKTINDGRGHLAGDACLKVFAERLSAVFPEALLTARIGGDEFAVILGNDEPADLIEARISRFLNRLRAPILWQGHMFTISASSGIAFPSDPHSYDAEELFISADAALYATKKRRRRARVSDRS